MVTLNDISQKTGLSVATVSHVLNNRKGYKPATREKVLEAAKELSYEVNPLARGLQGKSTRTVGVLWSLGRPNAEGVMREIALRVWRRGYVTYTADSLSDPDLLSDALADYIRRGVDAVILQADGYLLKNERILRQLKRFRAVVATVDEPIIDEIPAPIDLVVRDTHQVIRDIVDHFVASGRQAPCFIGSLTSNQDKVLPFLSRLRHHNLPTESALLDIEEPSRPLNHFDYYYDALKKAFSGKPTFDAIITAADDGTGAVLVWLKERGLRVPEDVAISALGNSDLLRATTPPIAGVERNHTATADAIDRLLFERLEKQDSPSRCETIPLVPIWRESAGSSVKSNT